MKIYISNCRKSKGIDVKMLKRLILAFLSNSPYLALDIPEIYVISILRFDVMLDEKYIMAAHSGRSSTAETRSAVHFN